MNPRRVTHWNGTTCMKPVAFAVAPAKFLNPPRSGDNLNRLMPCQGDGENLALLRSGFIGDTSPWGSSTVCSFRNWRTDSTVCRFTGDAAKSSESHRE